MGTVAPLPFSYLSSKLNMLSTPDSDHHHHHHTHHHHTHHHHSHREESSDTSPPAHEDQNCEIECNGHCERAHIRRHSSDFLSRENNHDKTEEHHKHHHFSISRDLLHLTTHHTTHHITKADAQLSQFTSQKLIPHAVRTKLVVCGFC